MVDQLCLSDVFVDGRLQVRVASFLQLNSGKHVIDQTLEQRFVLVDLTIKECKCVRVDLANLHCTTTSISHNEEDENERIQYHDSASLNYLQEWSALSSIF